MVKRRPADKEKVSDCAETVDVASRIQSTASLRLFGGHECRRAREPASRREPRIPAITVDWLHQTEIEQLSQVVDAAALADDDVARLDIAMDKPLGVRFLDGAAHLQQHLNDSRRRQHAMPGDELFSKTARSLERNQVRNGST